MCCLVRVSLYFLARPKSMMNSCGAKGMDRGGRGKEGRRRGRRKRERRERERERGGEKIGRKCDFRPYLGPTTYCCIPHIPPKDYVNTTNRRYLFVQPVRGKPSNHCQFNTKTLPGELAVHMTPLRDMTAGPRNVVSLFKTVQSKPLPTPREYHYHSIVRPLNFGTHIGPILKSY